MEPLEKAIHYYTVSHLKQIWKSNEDFLLHKGYEGRKEKSSFNSREISLHFTKYPSWDNRNEVIYFTMAGIAQSVQRLTAEWEVAGSIPRAGAILRVLKYMRNDGTAFALQTARPSLGSYVHVKWRSRLPVGDVRIR